MPAYFIKGPANFQCWPEGSHALFLMAFKRAWAASAPWAPEETPHQNSTHTLAPPLPFRPGQPWDREAQPRCLGAPKGAWE